MGLGIIAEGILRIEHKLDLLLKHLKVPVQQMHFIGQACPVCGHLIDYQVDLFKSVVYRRCGCSTGKQPPAQPLIPTIGAPSGTDQGSTAGDTKQTSTKGARHGRRG